MPTVKELREQRGALIKKQREMLDAADKEKRDLKQDEVTQWEGMDADADKLKVDIERREKLEVEERELAQPVDQPHQHRINARENRGGFRDGEGYSRELPADRDKRMEAEMDAFTTWVRFGNEGLNAEQRNLLNRKKAYIDSRELPPELRAQGVGTGSTGGYLVPQGFSEEIDKALKAFGGMREVARVLPTPTGNDLPWPTVDDTANVGELLAESVAAGAQDVAFGQVILKAYKYSSKVVLVSNELLQDSYFDVNAMLRDLLAERIGRITNTHFTTGTGTGQPKGVVTEAGSGKVGATGQTTSIVGDDLIDLAHSVNVGYRRAGQCYYMMADSSLKAVKKLKDTTNRYIWLPSLAVGEPDTINGWPYVVNEDVAAMSANAKSVLFGNFSKYIVRDVLEITLIRLVERYAEYGQVGFIAFSRHDGRAINAAAIKYYQNSAT